MPSSESPAPPHTATLDTAMSGSPAARTPQDVCGSAAPTRETNARSGSGCASVPMRPNPVSLGSGTIAKMSNAGSSYGWAARIAANTAARSSRGRDNLEPVFGHPLDGADAADRGRRAVVRQELPDPVTLQLHCE